MTDVSFIRRNIQPIAKRYGLHRIYLFGSYAKGSADEESDVDLLIEKGKPLSLLQLSGFRQDVMDALGIDVDVVTTAGIEGAFYDVIRGTEVLLYEE